VTEGETSRRELIKSALVSATLIGPFGLLAGCKEDGATGSGLTVVAGKPASFGAAAIAAGKAEIDYWRAAVGQMFKVTGPEGPMYATLAAVSALVVQGDRPKGLRAQPMVATFTLDRGYKPVGDALYSLVKGQESETPLFLQRAGTVDAPTLIAQFN
jgi:hypothetical protein